MTVLNHTYRTCGMVTALRLQLNTAHTIMVLRQDTHLYTQNTEKNQKSVPE